MSNIFFSTIGLIVGIFFMMLGIIAMMIPWDPGTRTALVQFIFENSISIVLFGFVFFLIGTAIVINLCLSLKRRYYRIRVPGGPVDIEETVIQDYLDMYWKRVYPTSEIPSRITLKKNKLHIFADLPYVPNLEQKNLLENIKNDLSDLLVRILGYHKEFQLSISFQRSPGNKSN